MKIIKTSDSDLDFIKVYFSSSIAVLIVILIFIVLIKFVDQSNFSNSVKTFIYDFIITYTILNGIYIVISIFALIKFVRRKLGVIYYLVPIYSLVGFSISDIFWLDSIFVVIALGLCIYIMFNLRGAYIVDGVIKKSR